MNYLFSSCEMCPASKQTTEGERLPLISILGHPAELLWPDVPITSVPARWLGVMMPTFGACPLGVTVQSL